VLTRVELATRRVERSTVDAPPSADALERLRDVANVVLAVVVGLASEPGTPATGDAAAAPGNPRTTVVVRTMVVKLGLAREQGDAPPLPSVGCRWLERARALSF